MRESTSQYNWETEVFNAMKMLLQASNMAPSKTAFNEVFEEAIDFWQIGVGPREYLD